jgi:TonB family protein
MSAASNPAAQSSESPNHRHRISPRQRVESLFYVDLGSDNGGFAINVSESGMTFQGIRPLQKDQLLPIKFKLLDNKCVETMAQVIWLNDMGKGGGLQFIDLPEESRRLINQWLSVPAQPGSFKESTSASSRQPEMKKALPIPAAQVPAQPDAAVAMNETEAVEVLPVSAPSPVAEPPVAAALRSVPSFYRTGPLAQPGVTRTTAKSHIEIKNATRAWIIPFLMGFAACVVIAIAVMVKLGVISVQFRLPAQIASENSAKAAGKTGPATPQAMSGTDNGASALGKTIASGSPVPTESAASHTENPPAEIVAAKPTGADRPAAKTAAPISSREPSLQQITKAVKPMAPKPIAQSRANELAPPALPSEPTPALGLPVAFSETRAPSVPGVNSGQRSAQQIGKFEDAQLVTQRAPVYPPAARAAGFSGSVELRFTITAQGNVRDVHVVKGNNLLAHAAAEAVQTWRYRPARRDGIPVDAETSTVFVFKPN